MKKCSVALILFCVAISFCFSQTVLAEDPEARKIMEKSINKKEEGDGSTIQSEMILIDKNGSTRTRKMISYSKKIGEENRSILFFLHPADVKGTGLLRVGYGASKEDDQWLFMPSLKKTKRILSAKGGRKQSFMGSDFTYADFSSLVLDDYNFDFYEKQKEIDVNGKKCWLIWAKPKSPAITEKTGYTKQLLYIRQDNNVLIRAKLFMEEDGYVKYMELKDLKKIDGVWTPSELIMSKKLGNKTVHKTIIKNNDTQYNQKHNDDMFTLRQLEKGL